MNQLFLLWQETHAWFISNKFISQLQRVPYCKYLGVLLDDVRKKVLRTFYALIHIGQLVDRKTDSNPTSVGLLQHSLDEWPNMPYKANTNCTE